MKQVIAMIMLVIVTVSLPCTAAQAEEYRLRSGDVVSIDVWGYDEFRPQNTAAANAGIVIRPDGNMSFILVGEIKAAGLTVAELTTIITARLSHYLIDPKVAINIMKFHTTRIYVLGEVNRPGLYEIDKQHNLLDAIGMANGYTQDAAKKNVFIIHKDKMNAPIKANLLNLLKNGDTSQNYVLEDGDVVYLSGNGRIDFNRDIMPWITAGYYVHDLRN